MPLFSKVNGFCTSTFLTLSKGKLKQTLEEVIKICKEVYLFLILWQVFCNGTEIVPQKFKRFESSRCWNPIPYMDSLMGLSRMEIVVLAWSSVYDSHSFKLRMGVGSGTNTFSELLALWGLLWFAKKKNSLAFYFWRIKCHNWLGQRSHQFAVTELWLLVEKDWAHKELFSFFILQAPVQGVQFWRGEPIESCDRILP